MTKYISVTETAKFIRQALKENFKGIKFSVRSDSYAGGASIRVSWTDGPCEPAVSSVVKQFEGASFDGMTDSKSYHTSDLNGEKVHFGADYVFCNRKMSREFVEAIAAQFCKRFGLASDAIKVVGNDTDAWANTNSLDYSQEHWFNDLLRNTDAKDMHRAYAAEDEREASQRAKWEAQAKQEAKERAEAQEKAEKERKAREQAEFDLWKEQNEMQLRAQFKLWKEEQERLAREEAKRQEEKRQAEEKARQQREQEERTRRQREQSQRDGLNAQKRSILATKASALAFFGLTISATNQDILKAFRDKVKASSDGQGGYTNDMDLLVKAKAKALQ